MTSPAPVEFGFVISYPVQRVANGPRAQRCNLPDNHDTDLKDHARYRNEFAVQAEVGVTNCPFGMSALCRSATRSVKYPGNSRASI